MSACEFAAAAAGAAAKPAATMDSTMTAVKKTALAFFRVELLSFVIVCFVRSHRISGFLLTFETRPIVVAYHVSSYGRTRSEVTRPLTHLGRGCNRVFKRSVYMLCVISSNRVNTPQASLTRVRRSFSVLRTSRSVEAERVVVATPRVREGGLDEGVHRALAYYDIE
ncbi:hypothetical protein [Halorubrum glutamatedens]|uniref:hypothetical protein n=1 Tax=Halorubrum glutamatedens TaxID=2707018 RepID=UPI0036D23AA0